MRWRWHRRYAWEVAKLIAALIVVVAVGFPLYGIFLTSTLHEGDLRSKDIPLTPRRLTADHYREVLRPGHIVPVRTAMLNSFVLAVLTAALSTLLALPAAYALARLHLPGKQAIQYGLASVYTLPLVLFVIPLFAVAVRLKLDDRIVTLAVLYSAFLLPFITWVLRGFVESIPKEVEEAGFIDGCSYWQLLLRIMLPLMRPGILAAMLFGFILSWVEFFTALIFTSKLKVLTVSLGLYRSTVDIQVGQMAAAAVLTMAPVLLLTTVFQRLISRVLTAGIER